MLQAIREKAQGWIAWVIVILISIPFALWGINEYLGVGGEPKVVKVNDREITERELDNAFQRFRMQLREQFGASYRAGMLDDQMLRRQVLNNMIQQELLAQAAGNYRMNAGDEMVRRAIASIPSYQKAGRFDYPTYQRSLSQQGMSPDGFARRMRAHLIVEQLTQMIEQSEFSTALELKESQRLREQKREFGYLLISHDRYLNDDPVDEPVLKAYYDSHQSDFRAPERVKLEYVELSLSNLARQIKPTEQDLASYLESHSGDFLLPEERRASHILISVEEGKEAEARQQAEAVLSSLRAGEEFAGLAKQKSQDPGSAPQGGDLGFFARGVMDKAFEEAAFSLKPGEQSDLIRSSFGYHIIKLHEVRGGGKADLAAVRDRVVTAYSREQARQQFDDYSERMANLAYEMPDSLEPLVEELGLKLVDSDWMTRQGGEGILKSPKVTAAAFSDDVMEQGNNSAPLELGPEQILILRVVAHEAASIKPLTEVKDAVAEAARQERAVKAAADAGAKALTELQSGKSLAEVAAADGINNEQPGLVDRYDAKLDPMLRNELYRLQRPAEGQTSYGGTALANGDYAVLALTKVVDGELGEDAADLRQGLDRSRGGRYYNLYLSALESGADIEYLNKKLIGAE